MCGLVAVVGPPGSAVAAADTAAMCAALAHRGPDDEGQWSDPEAGVTLAHRRLAILDLSAGGHQPMVSPDGRFVLAFNGEIYNYAELRSELSAAGAWRFAGASDSEALLAAWATWGEAALPRLLGMFAFVVWDRRERMLTAVRDRFGVKPLYLHRPPGGGVALASEIGALHAAGMGTSADPEAWARYLRDGRMEFADRTFWAGVEPIRPGHVLRWRDGQVSARTWYDPVVAVEEAGPDERGADEVLDEYEALVREAVALRFRSDVPVGIAVSGGLDSSTLLSLVDATGPDERAVHAFTFTTGDPAYDELPWVEQLLDGTDHPLHECRLTAGDVPQSAERMQRVQDGPFGGLPTLAYGRLFERAREAGVIVLLDGQGMDEQWAGYDYYRSLGGALSVPTGIVQGSTSAATRPACLGPGLRELGAGSDRGVASTGSAGSAGSATSAGSTRAGDRLLAAQLRDLTAMKLPRALRFNDRASMRASCELREPFLDHRLVELALRQPADRKIDATTGKVLLRRLAYERLGARDVSTPKRPVQTPQREWLRGPLREWARAAVEDGLAWRPDWLEATPVRRELDAFLAGEGDNAFFVWQWISLGLTARTRPDTAAHSGESR